MAYAFTVETLYKQTHDGLDIIQKYLGNCKDFDKALHNQKNAFYSGFRNNDDTPSSYLISPDKKIKDAKSLKVNESTGYWRIKDYGDEYYTPIKVAMFFTGLDFYPCLKHLYQLFGLVEGKSFFQAEIIVKTLDDTDERQNGWFNVVLKDTHFDLSIIGKFVTPELAKEYHFYSVDYYEKVFIKKGTTNLTYIKVKSTDSFPIFAYAPDGTNWYKTYAPLSNDKQYKHGYLGKKPERYVHGLQRLLDSIDTDEIDSLINSIKEAKKDNAISYVKELEANKNDLMLNRVFIATGGSDGLNIASLNENVIWFNSESEQLNHEEYNLLKKYVKNIYNLPDVDLQGVKYAYEVAENFWEMKTIWLPTEKLGTNGKDFRNWMNFYQNAKLESIQFHFQNLVNGALKMKFFERPAKNKPYKIKPSYLHYFLKVKGFFVYYPEKSFTDKVAEQEYIFIQIIDNVVSQTFPNEIRKFCERYLIAKGQTVEVIDLMKSAVQFSDKNLLGIDSIELDFTNNTIDTQCFFFKNLYAKVTAEKIEIKPYRTFENFVWKNSILQNDIFLENPFFKYYKNEAGEHKVEILRTDCEYMNFIINTSRIFWRDELEKPFAPNQEKEKQEYHEKNRFNLFGEILTEEQKNIQEQHFLNKCYAIGYMLHRNKIMSFAKMLFAMDDKPKESEEDSNGRTGKSLFFYGFEQIAKNRFIIDGKNQNLKVDKHLLHGLTKENDYIYIEDLELHSGINFFFNWITNSIIVNPKNGKPYEIKFPESPKVAVSTNYGLPKFDGSTLGRILFISFSDYYHVKTENYLEQRKVNDDFGGQDLFSSSWSDKQRNIHFNFLMQCVQFYLQNQRNEISAPQNNIDINNAMASMGNVFMDWAKGYFVETETVQVEKQVQNLTETVTVFETETVTGTLNEFVLRKDMQDDYNNFAGSYKKTSHNFKKSLEQYCKTHGYTLNPAEYLTVDGTIKRIVFNAKGKRTNAEHFFIRTHKETIETENKTDDQNKKESDDLPF
jgi:hypothetical protein